MRFYRVHFRCDIGTSAGYEFFTTRREAERRKREHDANNDPIDSAEISEISEIEVNPTKAGILDALNCYADHPNNG